MSDLAIQIENIGKLYRLGEIGTGTLSHDLNRWLARLSGKEDPFAKIGETNDRTIRSASDYVWALKDVNFEVKKGEVIGIIGRNGAGKSTLLKILSKVTTPTTGEIKINGRIASLLEVGTGFHPELTGRENIFLNGAILGMNKREIRKKFDEIVDFSGVQRYIDTPVKRYSSGMYVRLAFAVSAFLEPEILIVDEVLAVGDAEFQKKCLGRIQDVSKNDGRTVLFVSHSMSTIQNLCSKSILLKNGQVEQIGNSSNVIKHYLSEEEKGHFFKSKKLENKTLYFKSGCIVNTNSYNEDRFLILEFNIAASKTIKASFDLRVYDGHLQPCGYGSIGSLKFEECLLFKPDNNNILTVKVDIGTLAVGNYNLSCDLTIPNIEYLDRKESCIQFEVVKSSGSFDSRVFEQNWGYGSVNFDLEVLKYVNDAG